MFKIGPKIDIFNFEDCPATLKLGKEMINVRIGVGFEIMQIFKIELRFSAFLL